MYYSTGKERSPLYCNFHPPLLTTRFATNAALAFRGLRYSIHPIYLHYCHLIGMSIMSGAAAQRLFPPINSLQSSSLSTSGTGNGTRLTESYPRSSMYKTSDEEFHDSLRKFSHCPFEFKGFKANCPVFLDFRTHPVRLRQWHEVDAGHGLKTQPARP